MADFIFLSKHNKQSDLQVTTPFHTVALCSYLADPATSLASHFLLVFSS